MRVLVIVAALALGACGGANPATKKNGAAPPPPSVHLVTIEQSGPLGAIRASGVLAYQREAILSFKVGGVISSISVDEGDSVKAGQTLASLNLTELSASLAEADAALRTAEAQLTRTKTLFDRGFVSQARLDDAQLALERARAARQSVGFNRSQGVIVAPAAGVVLRRRAEPNQNVAPGAPVLEFGDVRSGLIVRVGVSSAAASRVALNDKVEVRINGAPDPRVGKVTRIAAKSNASTGVFDVEIAFPGGENLRSGQVADVAIAPSRSGESASLLRAPALALIDARADQGFVYVVDAANVARRRAVQTAGLEGDSVIILSGLAPGERIIGVGAAYVRDGQTVAPTVTAAP